MNYFWLGLLIVSASCSLWFFGKFSFEAWNFSQLDHRTEAIFFEWKILKVSNSRYLPGGKFTYVVNGKPYEAEGYWSTYGQLNNYAAETELRRLQKTSSFVWFKETRPSLCALERSFPFKSLIYAFVAAAISIYFFTLRKTFVLR